MHSHDSQASGRRTEGGEPRTLSRRSLLAVGNEIDKESEFGSDIKFKIGKDPNRKGTGNYKAHKLSLIHI